MSINSLKIRFAVSVTVAVATAACSTHAHEDRLIDEAMRLAGDNAAELQAVLDRYKNDDERCDAAKYLIMSTVGQRSITGPGMDSIDELYSEMPAVYYYLCDSAELAKAKRYEKMPLKSIPDAESLRAEYLVANLEDAWSQYKSRKWNRSLPPEVFAEYILPYRIGDEKLTEWRKPYREWLSPLEDTLLTIGNSVDAARVVSEFIKSPPYNDQFSTPHRSALSLLRIPYGYCRDDCDRTIYAMRSIGIPVGVDMMPVSPENGAAHQWNVVWDNISCIMRMFDNEKLLPTRDSIHYDQRRRGKVYRLTFAPELERLARYRKAKNPPTSLLGMRMRDVTAEYFGHNRAAVELFSDDTDDVYLGIFTPKGIEPIDIADVYDSKAVFTDIEPNLIYFPITDAGTVCGYPFIVTRSGTVHTFVPDDSQHERATLTRKYCLRFKYKERMERMVGTRIQSAPTSKGPWTDLHTVTEPPATNYYPILLAHPLNDRYLRILKPFGPGPNIAEVVASRDSLGQQTYPLSIAGTDDNRRRFKNITDGDILTLSSLPLGTEDCIIRIDSPDDIRHLFLVPHNDDNFVVPGQEYELLYFAGPEGWKSLGRKIPTGFSVDFEAPKGAVLWLRNLTKGREEQIFIWRDGRQLFNIDLYDFDLNAQ